MIYVPKNIRLIYGLKQSQIAEICGCSRWLVSQWERGKSSPNLEMLTKLANYLDIGIGDILYADAEGIEIKRIRGKPDGRTNK